MVGRIQANPPRFRGRVALRSDGHDVAFARARSGHQITFDTARNRGLSSPGRRTRHAPMGAGRVRVPYGVIRLTKPRGLMERIPRSPDEADLSAQEAPPRQGTWLPRPYEVLGRAPSSGRTPGSWSKASVGLTSRRADRPRLVMLSRPQDFKALQERGTMRSHPLLTARMLRTDLETTRFGHGDESGHWFGRRPKSRQATDP